MKMSTTLSGGGESALNDPQVMSYSGLFLDVVLWVNIGFRNEQPA